MAHFAELDENNIVLQVVVVADLYTRDENNDENEEENELDIQELQKLREREGTEEY